MVLCGKSSSDPFDEENSSWPDVAFFLTGLFISSGFALRKLFGNVFGPPNVLTFLF